MDMFGSVTITRFKGFSPETVKTTRMYNQTDCYAVFDRMALIALMEDMDCYEVKLMKDGQALREIRFEDRKFAREA